MLLERDRICAATRPVTLFSREGFILLSEFLCQSLHIRLVGQGRLPSSSPTSACRSASASLVHPVALGRTSGRPRLGRREPVWMSSSTAPRSPTGRRSALAHLRQQDRRHGRRLGDDRDRGAAPPPLAALST